MEKTLNKHFWNNKYKNNETGWDVGEVTAPLKNYIDQLKNKSIKILIPGAGNAYEAEYLQQKGFDNVYVADISPLACEQFKKRVPNFPNQNVICDDFFNLKGSFDLIVEQTFFCALDPKLRQSYADQCSNLLSKGGKIVGLMFDFPLTNEGPPFGGCKEEYFEYFSKNFNIVLMERSQNSIQSREGRELFVKMVKL